MVKYEDLPVKFNKHVIVDERTGVTHLSDHAHPLMAIMNVSKDLGEAEFMAMSDEHKMDFAELGKAALMSLMGQVQLEEGSLFQVVHCGPFYTRGGTLGAKNMTQIMRRYADIVLDGAKITEDSGDDEMAQWLRAQNDAAQASIAAQQAEYDRKKDAGESDDDVMAMMRKMFGDDVQIFKL